MATKKNKAAETVEPQTVTAEAQTEEVIQPGNQPAEETLGITDLKNVVKIIDHAAEQGAFKGWSVITQVQAVRNKFNAFVEYAEAQNASENPSA